MKLYANLHTHSVHSDGGYTPAQLALAAYNEGYGAAMLTDHDNVSGYTEFRLECEKFGLETLFGVEFNTPSPLLENQPKDVPHALAASQFHIVGVDFDPENPIMKKHLSDLCFRKTEITRQLFEKAVKRGSISGIEWEAVVEYCKRANKPWIGGSQLRYALAEMGIMSIADLKFLKETVFGKYTKEAEPPFDYKNDEEVINIIHEAGGLAILAHPHLQLFCLDALVEMGIDGVEVSHPLLTEEEKAFVYQYALDKNLYISGGSDHYGPCSGYYERFARPEDCDHYRPAFSYGTSKEYFDEIKNRQLNR